MIGRLLATLLFCHTALACGELWAAGVVSLNLCTDQYLVQLAPARIAALSPLARDPSLSVVAARAAGLPWVRADAEAVLALAPDLVLAADWGAQTTLQALERHGVRVVRGSLPENFPAIRAETRRLAHLLGADARGEALLAAMDASLAAVAPRDQTEAIVLEPRGYTATAGSLADTVLRAAGLRNGAAGQRQHLETLLTHPPALLVLADAPAYPSLATDFLRHPALARIPTRRLPPASLICGGPWTADAVVRLAR